MGGGQQNLPTTVVEKLSSVSTSKICQREKTILDCFSKVNDPGEKAKITVPEQKNLITE